MRGAFGLAHARGMGHDIKCAPGLGADSRRRALLAACTTTSPCRMTCTPDLCHGRVEGSIHPS